MIKNYTTKIDITKTMMEIQLILGKAGATHIFIQWENGSPKTLAFKYNINDKSIPFILPMNEDKLLQVFKKQKLKPDLEQVKRTGWRIIKDWIDSQMALITIELVKFEEVFLPYMYDMKNNETLFQKLSKDNFNQLEYKEKELGE